MALSSYAGNLSPDDQSANEDVFVRDRQTETTALLSISSAGVQANAWCFWPTISGDGRYVAFVSDASNLVAGDTNRRRDIFTRDRQTGQTARVSLASNGDQGNNNSGFYSGPALSASGSLIAFESFASNLAPGDGNGTDDVFVHDRAPTPPCAAADVNCDGAVDVNDLLIVVGVWGPCAPPPAACPADLNDDAVVNVNDLLTVIGNWG